MNSQAKRLYLSFVTKLLFLTGILLVAYALLSSLSDPVTESDSAQTPWHIKINLSKLAPGAIQKISWPQKEVWVYHRYPHQVDQLKGLSSELKDPDSLNSEQPTHSLNHFRSRDERFFIFLPYETERGCQVKLDKDGFSEICQGARFDSAGRIYKDSGSDKQRNLTVPPYRKLDEYTFQLLPPGS